MPVTHFMVRVYLFSLLLISWLQTFAQPYHADKSNVLTNNLPAADQFEHLSVKDGLSNNSVNCIIQDREGFIWFGTNEGLNKYDGYTFTVLKANSRKSAHRFLNSRIEGLCEDRSNRLWAVTEGGGLHEINKQTGHITPHFIQTRQANRWNDQRSVYEDSQGVLWVSTFAGLARYEPARHHFTLYPAPQPEAPILTVLEDRQHRFWVATHQGFYRFDRSTGHFTLIPVSGVSGVQPTFNSIYLDANDVLWLGTSTPGYSLFQLDLRHQPGQLTPYNPGKQLNSFVFLNSIHRDARGLIWLGTTSGLQGIDPVSQRIFTYRSDPNATKGLSSNSAQAVYHDRAGMLWVGTDNGIDRQAVNTKPFATYQVIPNKGITNLPENRVNALLKDDFGQLWLSNGFSVYRMAANQRKFQAIRSENLGSIGQHKNYVSALLANEKKGIWLGTSDGLYQFDQSSGNYIGYPSDILVQFIDRAPTGELWVGGEGGIASFNPDTHQYNYYKYTQATGSGLPDKYVHGLLVSRTGDVWVLIKRLGICRLNPRSGQFVRYTAGTRGQLTSNEVQSIYEDKAGIIWVGTHQGGLNRFDPQTGLFSAITSQNGLPGNSVEAITSDDAGHIWLSTDQGLCQFDPPTRTIRKYELTDGLPSDDFLQNSVFRQHDRLFFGSLNGVVYFNPDHIRDDTHPFPVYITTLNVLDKPWTLTSHRLTLNHDENFLSFGYSALAYTRPEQNQYAYQLVGIDKNWVQSGNRHFANYTNLSPGTYTFRVKAANSDGIWAPKEASLQLIIRPPWWATWWAYSVYALFIGGIIWGYVRFYTNRIRQQQELELNRRQAEQLKAVDELKTRFFSNITHEFRTPLSLIISPVEKLLQESRFDRQKLMLVQRNASQLLRLINQLLDLSKLEANNMAVVLMRGNVSDFVNSILDSFQQLAEKKGVLLHYTAEALPQEHLFDADKWEKILTNLLSNAVKFTEAGGQVTVTLIPIPSSTEAEVSSVQICIADSGIGISPENLPHIFDRFYQVDNSHTRSYEGTGIGLALTKELIELVGGTIAVESQLHVGTTFLVTLPVQSVSLRIEAANVNTLEKKPIIVDQLSTATLALFDKQPNGIQHTYRILIVEDNTELREFLVTELADSYQTLSAADGESGWQLIQTELPDIVISDIMMPRLDGYALTRLIKNNPETDHIPVVMLTAKAAQHSRIEGLQEGADDYLAKPFHLDELHLRLHNLISRQQKLQDHYQQQFIQPNTPSPLAVMQNAFLHRVYELLDNHLDDSAINVDWLADQLAMSRKTLYRKVNSLIQLSPNDLIRQYRLRKAADLLRSGHQVAETADLVGFKTPSHFTVAFKEFYQQTPTEFIANSLRKL